MTYKLVTDEKELCVLDEPPPSLSKKDIIYFQDKQYNVRFILYDIDEKTVSIFVEVWE